MKETFQQYGERILKNMKGYKVIGQCKNCKFWNRKQFVTVDLCTCDLSDVKVSMHYCTKSTFGCWYWKEKKK